MNGWRKASAAEVRALPVDSIVRIYHYDRRGELVYVPCNVVMYGKRKKLRSMNPWASTECYGIVKETERRWYEVQNEVRSDV